jgi:hypothetical protein
MLNLYAVKVWHLSGPCHFETIEVRTYTAQRAEHLASESFPGCLAAAEWISAVIKRDSPPPYYRPITRGQ